MSSNPAQQLVFFPKADAAVLSCRLATPPPYPETTGPIYDYENIDTPVLPWSLDAHEAYYPHQKEAFAPATIPDKHLCLSDRYLRASLAKNERLRLSMLWYYTRDIFKESEFLSGLQEKVSIAQETTGWGVAIVGILDVNVYIRLATVGVPLGILPRGETLCAHTVVQPPGSVFLLPNMLGDWRFADSPYIESGGLRAYAGAPLRLQNECGDTACFGSLCVASFTSQDPLTRAQQTTLVRLADWIVSDIVQLTRARRQRERRRMVDLIAAAQKETDDAVSEEPVIRILRAIYPDTLVGLHSSKIGRIEVEGRSPISLLDISDGLWEDTDHISEFIAKSNHLEPPNDRVVRMIAAQCESVSGQSLLTVGTKDFRLVFDDIDAWFLQTCAGIISQMWHKRLLAEVIFAKEKFLRGFSHQLRTPIHGILGSVELLAEHLKSQSLDNTISNATALLQVTSEARPDKEHGVYLDTIRRAGRDLISIINSMITLNRWADVAIRDRQYATYTTYQLESELANETLKAISGDARYNASIFFNHKLPPDHSSFRTDLDLLRDSLLPIIINAIQNTVEGIVAVTISVRPDLKALIVDVEDTGHGIPFQDHERIFELYEQVDVYSTGAGLGLTLASKFAALLEGSVDLVWSEINLGSHFRATFQNIEFAHPELHIRAVPMVPQLVNLPKYFHTVPSNPQTLSLCGQFAQFLTCNGLESSDDIKDTLVILDFAADPEQHRADLSRLTPDQVVICLLPFLEGEARPENSFRNVVYIYRPFLNRTMSLALEQADRIMLLFKSSRANPVQDTRDVDMRPKLEKSLSEDRSAAVPEANSRMLKELIKDPPSITDEAATVVQAYIVPEVSKLSQHNHIGNRSPAKDRTLVDPSYAEMTQLPIRLKKENMANFNLNGFAPAIVETDQVTLVEPRSPKSTVILSNRATTSHPTVLLVDDNSVNLQVMQIYCETRNLPYLRARDGLEAVSVFYKHQDSVAIKKRPQPIHLILMDLQMPGCDGIEATKQIRKLEEEKGWGNSVLFIMTSQDSPADREAANDAGSHEYYVKPVGIKLLDMGLKRYFPCFQPKSGSR